MSPSTNLKIKISSTGSHKSWKQIGSRQPFKCGDEIAKFSICNAFNFRAAGFRDHPRISNDSYRPPLRDPEKFRWLRQRKFSSFRGSKFLPRQENICVSCCILCVCTLCRGYRIQRVSLRSQMSHCQTLTK